MPATTTTRAATAASPIAVPDVSTPALRRAELDRQVEVLLAKGYPALSGRAAEDVVALAAPLREKAARLVPTGPDRLPFVLVAGRALVSGFDVIPTLELRGRAGFTSMERSDLDAFVPVADIGVPDVELYLLVDVDLGADSLNVPPQEALPGISAAGRTPITVEEGLAIVTQFPDVLAQSRFSLLGSRCGDRRVPAIWVSERRPRVGWCWDGAPHTWLGSASCAARVVAGRVRAHR